MQYKKGMFVVTQDDQKTRTQWGRLAQKRVVRYGDTGYDAKPSRGRRYQRGMMVLPRENSWN